LAVISPDKSKAQKLVSNMLLVQLFIINSEAACQ